MKKGIKMIAIITASLIVVSGMCACKAKPAEGDAAKKEDAASAAFSYVLDSSHEVDGRQGIAWENGLYYVSGSTSLSVYDAEWNMIRTETEPFGGFEAEVNHIGDIDVYNGEIYAGVEYFMDGAASNIQMAVYDAETLKLSRTYMFDPESGQTEVSGITVDPDHGYMWMCSWAEDDSGRYLYKYELESGKYLGKVRMNEAPQLIQGIAYYGGSIFSTADDGSADDDEPDHVYRCTVDPGADEFSVTPEKTLDDVTRQGEVEGISFDKDKKQMLISYNRGAVIVKGMPKGFYDGYDSEIHEVFVYYMTDPGERRRFIIDTDSGADDAAAIILAAKDSSITIEGVTVLAGNVSLDQGAENALMALETAGVSVPVYKGADESFSQVKFDLYSVFGEDGMGDADLIHPTEKAADTDAVDFILETVRDHPGEIEIITLGPATNIANAIQKDPETMKQVRMIWSMGTTGLGQGNATPVAEFNVFTDAEAYKIMLDSGVAVTVTGLDMCKGESMWTDEQFRKLAESGDTGSFIAKTFEKIRVFYKKNGRESLSVCDPEAVMCALHEDFIRDSIMCHASCITERGETYGQVIFYEKGFRYDLDMPDDLVYNVRLVKDVDKAGYFDRYLESIN